MERKVRTYDLDDLKFTFSNVAKLRITNTALQDSRNMGFTRMDIVTIVQQLKRSDFIKSMTTHKDHRVWQDVYNTEYNGYLIYLKFQMDEIGHFIISLKEK